MSMIWTKCWTEYYPELYPELHLCILNCILSSVLISAVLFCFLSYILSCVLKYDFHAGLILNLGRFIVEKNKMVILVFGNTKPAKILMLCLS